MSRNQLRQANRLLLVVVLITLLFTVAGNFALLANAEYAGVNPLFVIATIVAAIVEAILFVVIFIVKQDTRALLYTVSIAYTLLYGFCFIAGRSNSIYPYIVAILITTMLFQEQRVVNGVALAQLVMNLVMASYIMATAPVQQAAIEMCMLETIVSILVCVSAIISNKLMLCFHKEAREKLQKHANKSRDMSAEVVDYARQVLADVANSEKDLSDIYETTQAINGALSDIASSTSATADAINRQIDMTSSIQEVIQGTYEKTNGIVNITAEASEAVDSGVKTVEQLNRTAENSLEAGNQMKNAAEQLQQKSVEVRSITEIILNISSQTNLLALNASIEAARAGEAGRGFAVVADEIRDLAEQTKSATENITNILDTLVAEAQSVSERVEGTVATSKKQEELIRETSQSFMDIQGKMQELNAAIQMVSGEMNDIHTSNDQIVDSVQTLSASSEEVSVRTDEALDTSSVNVSHVGDFTERMAAIRETVEKLASYTVEEE